MYLLAFPIEGSPEFALAFKQDGLLKYARATKKKFSADEYEIRFKVINIY